TAARALLGPRFRVTRERGVPLSSELAPCVVATVHPASVLRASDSETRAAETRRLIEDLRVVAGLLAERPARAAAPLRGPRRSRGRSKTTSARAARRHS